MQYFVLAYPTNCKFCINVHISGGKYFGITDANEHEIEMFFDHTRIYKDDFEFIVKKESKCAYFYIHLIATPKLENEPIYTLTVSVKSVKL